MEKTIKSCCENIHEEDWKWSLLARYKIVIDLLKGQRSVADGIRNSKTIYLPVFALGELYLGAECSGRKDFHYDQIKTFLKIAMVLNAGEQTALIYSRLKADLKIIGTPIPENDIWIAAIAQEHSLPLVTRDIHFTYLPDLKILSW